MGQYGASKWCIGDYNGDGMEDTMRLVDDKANVILSWNAEAGDLASGYEGWIRGGTDLHGVNHWFTSEQGGFSESFYPTNTRNYLYSGGDFNGDGKDDIIDLNHDDADVYLSTASFEQANHMFDAMEDMVKVAIDDHRYMVAWNEYSGSYAGIYARFFNQYGEALSDPILIESYRRSASNDQLSIRKVSVAEINSQSDGSWMPNR